MAEDQRREDLLVTTDCLEAISVFKGWKNFMFILAVICLLLLQICFWLIDRNVIKNDIESLDATEFIQSPDGTVEDANGQILQLAAETKIAIAAVEPNEPNLAATVKKKDFARVLKIKFEHIEWLIRVCNYILAVVSILYCLILLFCLKISLIARLGGLNHISRAFLLALIAVVLILPWQMLFGGFITGFIYTPDQLLERHSYMADAAVLEIALYYLRFCGLWAAIIVVMIFAQSRSARWAKATLRRLGVV